MKPRHRLLATAVAAALPLAGPALLGWVPATAAGDGGTAPTEPVSAFPVTVDTKYGPVTVESEPQRVVSVGFTDQDHLLALGVIPVGVREWYGELPYATWPWATDELGDATPAVLSSTEINFEEIAALDPDLIIGVSSGMTEQEFATLSDIAPTVAQSGDYIDYGTPWQAQFRLTAEAVGRTAEATDIIAEIDGEFATARADHPEFEGATAAVAFFWDENPGAYASQDGRSRVLTDLGFTIPPEFDEIAAGAFFASFSAEQLQLLDTDVLVWIAGDGTALEAAENVPGREALAAFREGREIFTDDELTGAFSFNSPLSLTYVLERFVPMLAAAVDGDPSTAIPD